jgi:hypothetical protein
MSITENALDFVSDLSGRLAAIEACDDANGLAGAAAAAQLVLDRATTQLNSRVPQADIDEAAAEAKTALGW